MSGFYKRVLQALSRPLTPTSRVLVLLAALLVAGSVFFPLWHMTFVAQQYPEGLGATHPDVRAVYDEIETPKRYVEKISFGCCGDDGFNRALDEVLPGVTVADRQIVVAGIEAHVCVMQTVLELLRAGSEVHVCWECVSGRGREYRAHALDRMAQAGAVITNHESVAFEWARTKDHDAFRAMNRLLREGQLEE